jgi:hypothetical protein
MRKRRVQAWELRRNVLRRDLRSAVKQFAALAKRRTARARPQPRRNAFRPLSEGEATAFLRSASVTRRGLNDANRRQQVLHYRVAHKVDVAALAEGTSPRPTIIDIEKSATDCV